MGEVNVCLGRRIKIQIRNINSAFGIVQTVKEAQSQRRRRARQWNWINARAINLQVFQEPFSRHQSWHDTHLEDYRLH